MADEDLTGPRECGNRGNLKLVGCFSEISYYKLAYYSRETCEALEKKIEKILLGFGVML